MQPRRLARSRRALSESTSAPLAHLRGSAPPYNTRGWGQYHARALPRRSPIFEVCQPSPASKPAWCLGALRAFTCVPNRRLMRIVRRNSVTRWDPFLIVEKIKSSIGLKRYKILMDSHRSEGHFSWIVRTTDVSRKRDGGGGGDGRD